MNKKEFVNHVISKLTEHGIDANDDLTLDIAAAVAEDMEANGNIDDLIQQFKQTQTPDRASLAIGIAGFLQRMYLRA